MGRTQKAKISEVSVVSSMTPQPSPAVKRQHEKLRKSEPPMKRKKLAQELDEEISDSEFDAQLDKLRAKQKQLKGKKFDNLQTSKDEDNSEGDSEDEEEDSEDVDSDDDDDDECDKQDVESDTEDVDSDDDDEDVDSEDDEDTDKDDDEVTASEDEDSDEDSNDDSHMEHEDARATKSVTKSQQKKAKQASKKKQQKKKAEENIPIEATEMAQDLIAKALRDKRTLFLKNLPKSVTVDMIQSFSSDVLEVRMQFCKAKKSRELKCAFVEFRDEETAVKNKAKFEHMKIEDHEISVDFVGEKSTFRPKKPQFPTSVDPKKLYVSGIKNDMTVKDLEKLFPTASSIDFPRYKKTDCPKGFAFVHFMDEKACKVAHATMQNQVISGRVLTVMYAKKSQSDSNDSKKNNRGSRQPRKKPTAASDKEKEKDKNKNEAESTENNTDDDDDDSN